MTTTIEEIRTVSSTDLPISTADRKQIEQLYEALRKGPAKLLTPNGEAHVLPASLPLFLVELIGLLNEGKSVYLVQNQAKLTTVEASAMLGVSRQFLVSVLEKGDIPYHMVGTHRRIYAQDAMVYKAKRDNRRRTALNALAQAEVPEGVYDRTSFLPAVDADAD